MESVPAALLLFSFNLPLPPPPLEICVVQKELAADRKERFASQGAAGQVIEAGALFSKTSHLGLH